MEFEDFLSKVVVGVSHLVVLWFLYFFVGKHYSSGVLNVQENKAIKADEYQEDTSGETKRVTEKKSELDTVEKVFETGCDIDSQQEEKNQTELDNINKPKPALEMLQVTPVAKEDLTPEDREARRVEHAKLDKQQKIAHWNDVWPWGNRLGRKMYRDANTHLVPSKAVQTNKINFLKYQPVHGEKTITEENDCVQASKSVQEGQMKR